MSWSPPRLAAAASTDDQAEQAIEAVREAIARLRFGAIALTVHDGRVVQIEITEKRRFDA